MEKKTYLSEQGFQKLKAELQFLKSKERKRIANDISEAREKGDLSENAEYDAAKEAQGLLEKKIAELETLLAGAKIINPDEIDTNSVRLFTIVKILNMALNTELEYTIVPSNEADLFSRKISVESPFGMALMGKRVNDIAVVNTPNGNIDVRILEIKKSIPT